jgi:hypothetical protein
MRLHKASLLLGLMFSGALFPLLAKGGTPLAITLNNPSSLEDPLLNPWISPLEQCATQPYQYHLDIDMGFLNTDYFCRIDPKVGAQFDTKTIQSTNRDAARLVLSKVNACQTLVLERILVGASRNTVKQIQDLIPNGAQDSIIKIGKRNNAWSPPETHAKVFQLDNGNDQFFTVHGSLNLQTVGLTCKANNALRFTETTPGLYNYFQRLGDAVQSNNGKVGFGSNGEINSSGTQLAPINIGDYTVHFYGGQGMGFVGIGPALKNKSWPEYINPPITNQHAQGIVNWYDNIIYDAAKQLRQGRSVKIDVLIFEVGEESAFVNNLWRFVQTGFVNGKSEDKTSSVTVPTPFAGKLNIRFLWQFQSGNNKLTKTYINLNGPTRITNPPGNYEIETARIWPILNSSGIAVNPGTPRDMHNKLAVLDVPGHEEERRIYVTSSNMDTPNVGSGKLWQAGTTIQARSGTYPWSGPNSNKPNLWNAYENYFDLLWNNREGQPNAGQINFSKLLNEKRLTDLVNWIETTPQNSGNNPRAAEAGIDAFFFPIPIH